MQTENETQKVNTYRDPERLDLASASSFESDVFCPGRQNLLRALPPEAFTRKTEAENDPEDEASRGTRLHLAWETNNFADLDADDLDIYERGNKTGEKIIADWCQAFGITQFKEGERELRMWLHDQKTLKPILSAKTDKHFVSQNGTHALIDERKSLWCKNLTPSERNWQGRVQAVLIADEYGATHVRVAFNKAMFGKDDTVDYNEDDLRHCKMLIYYHHWQTKLPDAQRRPGSHCNYCPGKAFCVEAGAYALLPSISSLNAPISLDASKEGIATLVAAMTLPDLKAIHSRASIIGKILEEVKARLKGMTAEQLSAIGFGFGKPRTTRTILKTKECFEFLRDNMGINEAELWQAMEFGNSKLVDSLRRDQGWAKAKAEGVQKQMVEAYGEAKESSAPIIEL